MGLQGGVLVLRCEALGEDPVSRDASAAPFAQRPYFCRTMKSRMASDPASVDLARRSPDMKMVSLRGLYSTVASRLLRECESELDVHEEGVACTHAQCSETARVTSGRRAVGS